MTEPRSAHKNGFAGLPRKWATPVQLVGTFGLAVFLVLYYLLVMEPRQAEAYARLRGSVDGLRSVVEKRQALLSKPQADALDEMVAVAVASQVALEIRKALDHDTTTVTGLEQTIRELLLDRTHWLQGLARDDGSTVSEIAVNRIVESEVARKVADRALAEWRQADLATISAGCQEMIGMTLRRFARAK
ncbi:MAG: hypothetical protein IPK26_07330 [Planctomycetes bacterium]|nr:hypothetical protein [Planctomycetota bacterium]